MGLKTIEVAPFKMGKTVLALSSAQVGGVGYIDNEYHARPYLEKHPTLKSGGEFPFHEPMKTRTNLGMCQTNPAIATAFGTMNPVFLVETMDFGAQMAALSAFADSKEVKTIVIDSGSVVWDLLGDIADSIHEESAAKNAARGRDVGSTMGRLAWNKPKKYNRRFFYACLRSGKHIIVTAHMQEEWKEGADGKLVLAGVRPWLEKKSPHWADLIVEVAMPKAQLDTTTGKQIPPVPSIKIMGENLGGGPDGTLTKGKVLTNPTFATLIELTKLGETNPMLALTEDELDYRNRNAVEKVASKNTGMTPDQEDAATYPHGR